MGGLSIGFVSFAAEPAIYLCDRAARDFQKLKAAYLSFLSLFFFSFSSFYPRFVNFSSWFRSRKRI